jgi:hypothetical protein
LGVRAVRGHASRFDLATIPAEDRNCADDRLGRDLADMLYAALVDVEAPTDQFARLGYS